MIARFIDAAIFIIGTAACAGMLWLCATMTFDNITYLLGHLSISLVLYTWGILSLTILLAAMVLAGLVTTALTIAGRIDLDIDLD